LEKFIQHQVQHKWILTIIDYFTKLVEAIPARNATNIVVIKFLKENILSRFDFPKELITNNAQVVSSVKTIELC